MKSASTKMRKALAEAIKDFRLCDPEGDRAKHLTAPEDEAVLALCLRHGFGAVMDSAARQWRKRDDVGAFTGGVACTPEEYAAQEAKDRRYERKQDRERAKAAKNAKLAEKLKRLKEVTR